MFDTESKTMSVAAENLPKSYEFPQNCQSAKEDSRYNIGWNDEGMDLVQYDGGQWKVVDTLKA